MDNARLSALLECRFGVLQGRSGAWRVGIDDFELYVMTDEVHDRMRVMIPIGGIDPDDSELLMTLLGANFDRALDAKYAVYDGVLWATFLHRLSWLTEDEFDEAITQVIRLAEATGTTFASGDLVFGGTE